MHYKCKRKSLERSKELWCHLHVQPILSHLSSNNMIPQGLGPFSLPLPSLCPLWGSWVCPSGNLKMKAHFVTGWWGGFSVLKWLNYKIVLRNLKSETGIHIEDKSSTRVGREKSRLNGVEDPRNQDRQPWGPREGWGTLRKGKSAEEGNSGRGQEGRETAMVCKEDMHMCSDKSRHVQDTWKHEEKNMWIYQTQGETQKVEIYRENQWQKSFQHCGSIPRRNYQSFKEIQVNKLILRCF